MKSKYIRAAVLLLTSLLLMTACKPIVEERPASAIVYATFYPIYALAEIISDGIDGIELHCLVQPQDDCLRTYDLSDWDLYMLAYSADAILAAGGGLEGFAEKIKEIGETTVPVTEVMHGLEFYQAVGISDEDSHFAGENPHLFMSVEGAEAIAENISGTLSVLDSENADAYERNLVGLNKALSDVKEMMLKQTEVCEGVPAAVMHEALFYPADECGLDIRAWYEREGGEMLYGSALDDCLNNFSEKGVKVVLLENYAPAELVSSIESAGYIVVLLDVMSTLSEKDGSQAYLEALMSNVSAIVEGCKESVK